MIYFEVLNEVERIIKALILDDFTKNNMSSLNVYVSWFFISSRISYWSHIIFLIIFSTSFRIVGRSWVSPHVLRLLGSLSFSMATYSCCPMFAVGYDCYNRNWWNETLLLCDAPVMMYVFFFVLHFVVPVDLVDVSLVEGLALDLENSLFFQANLGFCCFMWNVFDLLVGDESFLNNVWLNWFFYLIGGYFMTGR